MSRETLPTSNLGHDSAIGPELGLWASHQSNISQIACRDLRRSQPCRFSGIQCPPSKTGKRILEESYLIRYNSPFTQSTVYAELTVLETRKIDLEIRIQGEATDGTDISHLGFA